MSEAGDTLPPMSGGDWFDFGMGLVPRKYRRTIVVVLLLLTGGGFATWYALEKVESVQASVQQMFDGLIATLPTPTAASAEPTP